MTLTSVFSAESSVFCNSFDKIMPCWKASIASSKATSPFSSLVTMAPNSCTFSSNVFFFGIFYLHFKLPIFYLNAQLLSFCYFSDDSDHLISLLHHGITSCNNTTRIQGQQSVLGFFKSCQLAFVLASHLRGQ